MLVALTARTRRRGDAGARRAPRGRTRRSAASSRSVSNTCEPGAPGSSAVRLLALADRDLRRRPASKRTARQLPVPASIASSSSSLTPATAARLTTLTSGSPAAKRAISSAIISRALEQRLVRGAADVRREHDVVVARAAGGGPARRRAGRRRARRRPRWPERERRVERVLVDERLAGGVDEVRAGLHRGERARVEHVRVVRGRPARAARRSRRARAARRGLDLLDAVVVRSTVDERVVGEHAHPERQRARARRAGRPGRSRPGRACGAARSLPMNFAPSQLSCELAAARRGSAAPSGSPRASMTRKASVSSATASAFLPGVFTSGMPRSVDRGDVDVDRAAARAADEPQARATRRAPRR